MGARYAESELLYTRALTIRRGLCGSDSPDTANLVFNLGLLFEAQGDLPKAEVRNPLLPVHLHTDCALRALG